MAIVVLPCRPEELPVLRSLARDPSLAHEFAQLQTDAGFDDNMADPFLPPGLRWVATRDGQPAGLAFAFLAPTGHGSYATIRVGVTEAHRGRGVASALLSVARAGLARIGAEHDLRELNLSAWEPNPAAEAFASRHGFHFARRFWRMERPRSRVERPHWPPGITMHNYDGGERALADLNGVYNRSFALHYHYVRASLEDMRRLTAQHSFRADGVILAYRGEECVGFCRNARYGEAGEVALLGTVPKERGIGLGRALLRWAVAWLQAGNARPLYLMVDGENESALRLYRSEGFRVALTRALWSLSPARGGA